MRVTKPRPNSLSHIPFLGHANILAGSSVPDGKICEEKADHANLKNKVLKTEFFAGIKDMQL
jgi:hypothetical protein